MYCKKCGKEIPEGAGICGYCGNPVQEDTGFEQNQNRVYKESNPTYSGQSAQFSYSNYQTQNSGYGYGVPVNPMDGGAVGFAITSLVLGIVALLIVCCVSIWWLTLLVAILGIVFGVVSLRKRMGGRGMAIAGIVCSIAALVFEIFLILLGVGMLAAFFTALLH